MFETAVKESIPPNEVDHSEYKTCTVTGNSSLVWLSMRRCFVGLVQFSPMKHQSWNSEL